MVGPHRPEASRIRGLQAGRLAVAQPSRLEAIQTLDEGHSLIHEQLARLTEDQATRPATVEGDWSVQDLIGHVATWEEVAFRTLLEFQRGEMPWIETGEGPFSAPATGKVDAFNATTVADKRSLTLDEVRTGAVRAHRELIEAIAALSDQDWSAKASYPTRMGRRRRLVTLLGSVLGAPQRPFGHAFAHLPPLEGYANSAP